MKSSRDKVIEICNHFNKDYSKVARLLGYKNGFNIKRIYEGVTKSVQGNFEIQTNKVYDAITNGTELPVLQERENIVDEQSRQRQQKFFEIVDVLEMNKIRNKHELFNISTPTFYCWLNKTNIPSVKYEARIDRLHREWVLGNVKTFKEEVLDLEKQDSGYGLQQYQAPMFVEKESKDDTELQSLKFRVAQLEAFIEKFKGLMK